MTRHQSAPSASSAVFTYPVVFLLRLRYKIRFIEIRFIVMYRVIHEILAGWVCLLAGKTQSLALNPHFLATVGLQHAFCVFLDHNKLNCYEKISFGFSRCQDDYFGLKMYSECAMYVLVTPNFMTAGEDL